jgi:hypothetical protein
VGLDLLGGGPLGALPLIVRVDGWQDEAPECMKYSWNASDDHRSDPNTLGSTPAVPMVTRTVQSARASSLSSRDASAFALHTSQGYMEEHGVNSQSSKVAMMMMYVTSTAHHPPEALAVHRQVQGLGSHALLLRGRRSAELHVSENGISPLTHIGPCPTSATNTRLTSSSSSVSCRPSSSHLSRPRIVAILSMSVGAP